MTEVYLTNPEIIANLPPAALRTLIGVCRAFDAIATARLLTGSAVSMQPREAMLPGGDDQILDADGIAAELGVARAWVFRNARKLPFVRRISRKALSARRAEVRRWCERQKA